MLANAKSDCGHLCDEHDCPVCLSIPWYRQSKCTPSPVLFNQYRVIRLTMCCVWSYPRDCCRCTSPGIRTIIIGVLVILQRQCLHHHARQPPLRKAGKLSLLLLNRSDPSMVIAYLGGTRVSRAADGRFCVCCRCLWVYRSFCRTVIRC